jgi:hypothetical protein
MQEEGVNLLTGDEAHYFQSMETMFSTEGWQLLKREIGRELEAMPAEKFWSCHSYEELVQARLRYLDLQRMANMEAEIEERQRGIIASRLSELSESLEGQYE